jgi:CCR4-NOT transcription complex subunit 4
MELAAKDNGKGKCPACRTEYDESTIQFNAPPREHPLFTTKKKRVNKPAAAAAAAYPPSYQSPHSHGHGDVAAVGNGGAPGGGHMGARGGHGGAHGGAGAGAGDVESRRHLFNVRVIQRNLVYVVGLTAHYCREKTLRRHDLFGKVGIVVW